MNSFVSGHVTTWIPNTAFEWVFVVECFTLIEHLSPCYFLAVRARNIVDWNVLGPEEKKFSLKINDIQIVSMQFHCQLQMNILLFCRCDFIGNCDQSIDGNVNWNNFRAMFTVAQHCTNYTFSTTNHNTDRSVQAVYPSLAWFFPSW